MFDIGFSEILVIALIGLIFIGPERLPETVRTISLYIGRFKRSLRETRREIEQQLGADDIRRELHNEEVMRSLEKLRTDVKKNIDETLNLNETLELDKTRDLEEDFYPPGHHNHDPNNDIDDAPEPWQPETDQGTNENTIGQSIDGPTEQNGKKNLAAESSSSTYSVTKSSDSIALDDASPTNKPN